jgi:molybdate transport system ATP-binding protein
MSTDLSADFARRYARGPLIRAALRMPADSFSVTALFGPSGSGKTTVLRCLAGLDRPDEGYIHFGGEIWFDGRARIHLPPQRRAIGYLSQDYALFPHLTVSANIAYGLGRGDEGRRRVAELVGLFGLTGLEGRYPGQLSGGEQQRTALARTLARRPRLLLLDEPLSALDAPTREPLRRELQRRLAEAHTPTVLVTHDPIEALSLADTVLVLDAGRVRQSGSVAEVFASPADAAVARIVGVETVEPARILACADGRATVAVGSARLSAMGDESLPAECYACIRAEDVALAKGEVSTAVNQLGGSVRAILPEGPMVRVEVDCGFRLTALLTRQVHAGLDIREGDSVTALVSPRAIALVPPG